MRLPKVNTIIRIATVFEVEQETEVERVVGDSTGATVAKLEAAAASAATEGVVAGAGGQKQDAPRDMS